MAALLGAINAAACTGPGRRLPDSAPENLPACEHALGSSGAFIFDVHTHHVMSQLPWRTTAPDTLRLVLDMLPPDCTASNPLTCVDRSDYLHDMFPASDTVTGPAAALDVRYPPFWTALERSAGRVIAVHNRSICISAGPVGAHESQGYPRDGIAS